MEKTAIESSRNTFIRFVKNPRTDITTNIPMNSKEIYCIQKCRTNLERKKNTTPNHVIPYNF